MGPKGNTTVYTFQTTVGANRNVLIGATTAASAGNLQAAINDNSSQCVSTAPCFGSLITAPNPGGAATLSGSAVTVTAPGDGAAYTLTLTTSSAVRLPVSGKVSPGTGANDGLNFLVGGTTTITATNLAAAIARNGATVGVTSTSAAAVVTVTATTEGTAGNSITLAKTLANFTWASGTLTGGVNAQATIGAFDNLYATTCSGTVPMTYWAYNTDTTTGAVVTSPVLSGDGKQVAFIQNTASTATLVLLKWKANDGNFVTPTTPTNSTSAAAYNTCATLPCMFTITFSNNGTGNANSLDSHSSPFYDYASDTLYVGNDLGWIHKFNPVFKGAPAEVTTTWPVQAASTPLSSPVFDDGSGLVLVAASFQVSNNSGGRIHSISATTGTVIPSGILGPSTTGGTCHGTGTSGDAANLFVDGLILDPTTETFYTVLGNDGNGNSVVVQLPANFSANACGVEVTLGTGSTTGVPVYAGDFDNLFYGGAAGHMYVCGNAGGGSYTLSSCHSF